MAGGGICGGGGGGGNCWTICRASLESFGDAPAKRADSECFFKDAILEERDRVDTGGGIGTEIGYGDDDVVACGGGRGRTFALG